MRYVIIGAGPAGIAGAEGIRRRDPTGEIVMISDEEHPPYYRPLIPYLIEGTKGAEAIEREPARLPAGVDVRLGRRVEKIDPGARTVTLEGGERLEYSRLLLAVGSAPLRPPVAGLDGPGVYILRNWDDALAIAAAAEGARSALILGAGRIGMKCAFSLRRRGLDVTVVEAENRLVPLQFDEVASAVFGEVVDKAGIAVELENTFTRVLHEANQPKRAVLLDGTELEADFVVVATGVQPNRALAQGAGLRVERGVIVDETMCTSDALTWGAGDAVQTTDLLTGGPMVSGIWTNAVAMGHVAGENMAGGDRRFAGAFSVLNAMDLGGVAAISVGEVNTHSGDGRKIVTIRKGNNYRKLTFRDDVLVGFILIGSVEGAGVLQTLIREKKPLGELRNRLVEPRFGYGHFVSTQPIEVDRYVAV